MSTPLQFRLRWKGAITGPFPLTRISDLLRSGEISLLHNIEVDGGWLTVRDYFRATGLNRTTSSPVSESAAYGEMPLPPGRELSRGDTLPADTSQTAAGESLERSVREGYLWCGSTFLCPPLFALLVYAWDYVAPETPPISLFILLVFTTAMGCFLPVVFVRKVGRSLDQEGLAEIRQTQANLSVLLASLGFMLWLWCFWILVHQRLA